MNGGLKRDGNGKTLSDWGRTRFSSFERTPGLTRARHVDAQVSALRSKAAPSNASAPLEDSPGASHITEAGVRVEMMKIESDPNFYETSG